MTRRAGGLAQAKLLGDRASDEDRYPSDFDSASLDEVTGEQHRTSCYGDDERPHAASAA